MLCPYCRRETSEMLRACEWCHGALGGQAGPPPGQPQVTPGAQYPQAGQPPAMPQQVPGQPVGLYYPPGVGQPPPPRMQRNRHPLWTWLKVAVVSLVAVLAFFFVGYMLIGWGSSKEISAHPELVKGGKPTVVEFYSSAGGSADPQMMVIADQLAKEYSGQVAFTRIFTTIDPETMKLYNIDTTPAFIALNSKGALVSTVVGLQGEKTMHSLFQKAAASSPQSQSVP